MAKKLTYEDRKKLEIALNENKKVSQIAEELNYSQVTIYSEIKRGTTTHNKYSATRGQYIAQKAKENQGRPTQYKENTEMIQEISKLIGEGRSTSEAAELIRNKYNVDICAKTIHNYKEKGLLIGIASNEELNKEIPTHKLDMDTRLFLSRAEKNRDYLRQGIHKEAYEVANILSRYKADVALDMCKYLECDYTREEIANVLETGLTVKEKKKKDTLTAFGIYDAMQIFEETLNDTNLDNIKRMIESCYTYTSSLNNIKTHLMFRTETTEGNVLPVQIRGEMERLKKWVEIHLTNYPTMISVAAVYEHITRVSPYKDESTTKLFAYLLINQILIKDAYLPINQDELNNYSKNKEKTFLEHLLEVEMYKLAKWS